MTPTQTIANEAADRALWHLRTKITVADAGELRSFFADSYIAAIQTALAHCQPIADTEAEEVPCVHEWYQGKCVHCEIPVGAFRAERAVAEADGDKRVTQAQNVGNGLYLAILKSIEPYFPKGDRGLDWDVLPSTLATRLAADSPSSDEPTPECDNTAEIFLLSSIHNLSINSFLDFARSLERRLRIALRERDAARGFWINVRRAYDETTAERDRLQAELATCRRERDEMIKLRDSLTHLGRIAIDQRNEARSERDSAHAEIVRLKTECKHYADELLLCLRRNEEYEKTTKP